MKKEYLVITETQVGSPSRKKGIKRFVWGHYDTKKKATEMANKLSSQFKVSIEINER